MRRIAVEEHFYTLEYLEYLRARSKYPRREITQDQNHCPIELKYNSPFYADSSPYPSDKDTRLVDIGEGRIRNMDDTRIDVQVLALSTPGVEEFDANDGISWAQQTNNALAEAVQIHADRFIGLAALPMQEPQAAALELERAVKDLGLKGAKIHSHVHDEYLDEFKFRAVFETAQRLNVPLYLHPNDATSGMIRPYLAHPTLAMMLGSAADAALCAMRLVISGLFDEYPRLNIILGHLGEGLPFWLWRMDMQWERRPAARLKRKISDYLRSNFFYATSGMFSPPAFRCVCEAIGVDRLLFAVDYPFQSNRQAVDFMDALPLSDSDKEQVYSLNAARLFAC